MIIDAHLDLAYNALRGRDLSRPARQQACDEEGTPTVSIPDLRSAGVGLVCGTIFCEPATRSTDRGYSSPDQANAMAMQQLAWYQQQIAAGTLHLVRGAADLATTTGAVKLLILMEGADPLRNADDVRTFHDAGLRIVGLAWKKTRHAGGTGNPGPLTPEGVALVKSLDQYRIIHDISHLAEESFWQLLDISARPVIASHSNCRALIPTDRHLSDAMIKAIANRGGVIGINFYDKFLIPPARFTQRRATLADVISQVRHICDLLGNHDHVGLGTDMDGGFGREHMPAEIKTAADLPLLSVELSRAGFGDDAVHGIMSANWLRFFRATI